MSNQSRIIENFVIKMGYLQSKSLHCIYIHIVQKSKLLQTFPSTISGKYTYKFGTNKNFYYSSYF